MTQYGPRTVYVIALKEYPGCHEFLLQDDGSWLHVKETTEIGETPVHRCHQAGKCCMLMLQNDLYVSSICTLTAMVVA